MTRHVPDLSIIFSTHLSPSENEIFKVMLRKSSGLSKNSLEILMFENYNQFSLSEIYNKGLNTSKALEFIEEEMAASDERDEIVCFIRESERGIIKRYAKTDVDDE